ncbi:MAG TPA: alpha/beta fold hydrolase [Chloroflexota bacterium]|nr:alpha/beta fold hydrolase [Chloroflexota bacterium]
MNAADLGAAHRYADLGHLRLHYVEAGAGPLVVLLHGFPEHYYAWRHQWGPLAAAGYHVVAPDMRGYNLSGKPRSVRAYRMGELTHDVAVLIRHCGAERAAMLVGHDWGGAVAWGVAMRDPALLERLAILNCPHPVTFARALATPRQLLRSWYIFFFQFPWLPEWYFARGDFAALRRILRAEPVRPGAFTAADIERYVQALRRPRAFRGAINYYRAFVQYGLAERRLLRRIDIPTLVIWGERDRYLGRELAAPPPAWVPTCRVERLPDASHWLQSDQPERVNALLLDFLRTPVRPAGSEPS